MSLRIPATFANWKITISNNGGGASARSSIALGTYNNGDLTATSVARVANLMRDNLKTLWDNNWEVGPIHVNETSAAGVEKAWDDYTEEAGTHSADVYAGPQIAHVVKKGTGLAGKQHRGRVYLPGVPQGYLGEDGGINPTRTAEVDAAFAALFTAVNADAAIGDLVLLHDESTPGLLVPDILIGFVTSPQSGTMRPRNRR